MREMSNCLSGNRKGKSMGYGLNLKKAIQDNRTTVYKVAKETGISSTTLYSCIQRDSEPSLENAMRLSSYLGVKLSDLCDTDGIPGSTLIGEEGIPNTGIEYMSEDPNWGLRDKIEYKLVPILLGYKTVDLDRFVVPLLMKYLILSNRGMEIALEVIDALHSTYPDGMREDFLDEAMHGAFTPGQTREYYKELMDELDRRKTDTI